MAMSPNSSAANLQNLSITGSGNSRGGSFRKLKITGEGRVDGDVGCEQFRSTGSALIHGALQSQDFRSYGSVTVEEGVKCEKIRVLGQGEFGGDVSADNMTVYGEARIKGRLSGEQVKWVGQLHVGGNCEAEKVIVRGTAQAGGILSGFKTEIKLYGPSKVNEIGGGIVRIKRSFRSIIRSLLGRESVDMLTAEVIEGDHVVLENTTADIVRGKNVYIGPGCHIRLVEYTHKFQQSRSSKVIESVKV
ncbi:hypothetical protein PASE110613_08430 [Paenibacillus sediminis]|uniref:Cytoskeletal protein CcmA (Bactofilin family) n=1 Tax=Paenibacillus sediminis TaxID=664909 RepID=A0ABS4H266_9BACL|nr:hypothetical protein [Paenibacillus sediminis]MBP1936629.1 cytoskeletal protein CcmA (bactofilin family) [Paenibacillus sediminis]